MYPFPTLQTHNRLTHHVQGKQNRARALTLPLCCISPLLSFSLSPSLYRPRDRVRWCICLTFAHVLRGITSPRNGPFVVRRTHNLRLLLSAAKCRHAHVRLWGSPHPDQQRRVRSERIRASRRGSVAVTQISCWCFSCAKRQDKNLMTQANNRQRRQWSNV